MRRFGAIAQIASLLVLFTMLLTACGGGSSTTTGSTGSTPTVVAKKVALVTDVGGLNDQGFNQLSYAGYKKAEAEYSFSEKVVQTTSPNDYVTNLTNAAQVADLVIGVGFLMQTPIDEIAKKYPTKKFALIDGCPT